MRVLVIKADLLSADAAAIPPLGSLHIADVARRLGADAEVIDLRLVSPPRIGETVRRALANRPDVVGLSALPQDHRFVKRLAAYVRALGGPELFLVGGGPYFASCADDALRHTPIDAAVLGEGERTFEQLLRHWQGGTSWREVRGIAYRNNGSTVENPPQELLTTAELDALHPLGWDLIDLREYARFASYSGRSGTVYAPMLTSRRVP
jgi:anaerobic magnesium-protoporphyrin IX monomethyl ester cyclase